MFSFSGASSEANLPKSINSLERMLDAKVRFAQYNMSNYLKLSLAASFLARAKDICVKFLPSCPVQESKCYFH